MRRWSWCRRRRRRKRRSRRRSRCEPRRCPGIVPVSAGVRSRAGELSPVSPEETAGRQTTTTAWQLSALSSDGQLPPGVFV